MVAQRVRKGAAICPNTVSYDAGVRIVEEVKGSSNERGLEPASQSAIGGPLGQRMPEMRLNGRLEKAPKGHGAASCAAAPGA
jgi:hypothetical protein